MAKFTVFHGTDDDDVLNFIGFTGSGTPNRILVIGHDGDDRINLNGFASSARGGDGNDTIAANHGHDVVRGDAGNDLLKGQGGFDHLYGGDDNDTILGDAGNDTMIGGRGEDEIIGGNGDDVLFGDLSGGKNKNGAAFADAFRFDTSDGFDKVRDFGIGVDTVFLHGLAGDDYTLSFNGSNSFVTFGSTQIKFVGVELTNDDIVKVEDGMTF